MIPKPFLQIDSNNNSIVQRLSQEYDMDGAYLLDGFDEMVTGVFVNAEGEASFVYDAAGIVDHMVVKHGLALKDAWDHFYYDIQGYSLGKRSPFFNYENEIARWD